MSIIKTCECCGKEFKTFKAWLRNGNAGRYCSKSCSSKSKAHSDHKVTLVCQECGKLYAVRKYRKDISLYCSTECRKKHMPKLENHHNWKGGKSVRIGRQAIKEAIKRDGKCIECGSMKHLQGHHKKLVSEYPELAGDLSNIITLCAHCHAEKHPELEGMIDRPRKRKGIYRKCNVCGKEIYVNPSQIETKWTCSDKCRAINNSTTKTEGIFQNCIVCGKEFYVRQYRIGSAKYCSRECHRTDQKKGSGASGKLDTKGRQ